MCLQPVTIWLILTKRAFTSNLRVQRTVRREMIENTLLFLKLMVIWLVAVITTTTTITMVIVSLLQQRALTLPLSFAAGKVMPLDSLTFPLVSGTVGNNGGGH